MNIILCALNAKFIHSSFAVHSLMANVRDYREHIMVKEFTINHSAEFILSELYRLKPDAVAFSCYLWNIEMIRRIAGNLKRILPDITIILGGPEVSYEYTPLLASGIDYIIVGEGEAVFKALAEHLLFGQSQIKDIPGIAYSTDGTVVYTGAQPPLALDSLPFVYEDGFEAFQHRIVYYETSRGCPFRCQYCLSSVESGVRLLSLERARKDLDIFLNARLRQVKLIDRTFNCDKQHALGIWRHMIENDNGVTNFHFEIAADLLDDEMLSLLKTARKGQIQFEIGVQSTNRDTLRCIQRKTNQDRLFENVRKIKAAGNIHLHLDLIAGLPGEDYASFKNSFNDVYAYAPDQLQLGFLKLLKGSGLRADAERYGIHYRPEAPYEVLYTKDISFGEILALKEIEEMLELYFNSHQFLYTVRFIVPLFGGAFTFYRLLSEYWREKEYHLHPHSKMQHYTILYEFCAARAQSSGNIGVIRDLLRFDMFLCDHVKTPPDWLAEVMDEQRRARDFYSNTAAVYALLPAYKAYSVKQISRMCAVQKFDYDIAAWISTGYQVLARQDIFVLFDYRAASDHSKFIDITAYLQD